MIPTAEAAHAMPYVYLEQRCRRNAKLTLCEINIQNNIKQSCWPAGTYLLYLFPLQDFASLLLARVQAVTGSQVSLAQH